MKNLRISGQPGSRRRRRRSSLPSPPASSPPPSAQPARTAASRPWSSIPATAAPETGAKGRFGNLEKDITLAIGLKLKALIEKEHGLRGRPDPRPRRRRLAREPVGHRQQPQGRPVHQHPRQRGRPEEGGRLGDVLPQPQRHRRGDAPPGLPREQRRPTSRTTSTRPPTTT
ncbi:MAG: N-acetylmuramoyl-L-alanine amidase [Marinilabiliales bacterium]|nr:N-acetylmuramoyl-L-alanine amidase [Marinilabiliales bacterium]